MNGQRAIEIVGGGLAGLSLALALRRAGVAVTLFEAGHYPRHRVCGEFIAGLTDTTIEALGLGPMLGDAVPHCEVAWFLRGVDRPARVQRLPEPARGLSRFALDARIAAAFVALGGELCTGVRVVDLAPREGRVLATGRARRAGSEWIGLKCHVRDYVPVAGLELHLGRDAYAGCAMVEDGSINVCGLFRRRALSARGDHAYRLLPTYLRAAGLERFAARLDAATFDRDSFSAVAGLGFDRVVPAPTAHLTLGDACAVIPPFTGNGMAMALQSAEVALGPLCAYASGHLDWTTAREQVEVALRRRFRTRLAAADWLHPFLLQTRRQRWLAAASRTRLLPLGPMYRALH